MNREPMQMPDDGKNELNKGTQKQNLKPAIQIHPEWIGNMPLQPAMAIHPEWVENKPLLNAVSFDPGRICNLIASQQKKVLWPNEEMQEELFEVWIDGYAKRDGWIWRCIDEKKNQYKRIIHCDLECLGVFKWYEVINGKLCETKREIRIRVTTEEETKVIEFNPSWEGKQIMNELYNISAMEIEPAISSERVLKNLFSRMASSVKVTKVITSRGWIKIQNQMYYVYDNHDKIWIMKLTRESTFCKGTR